MITILWMTLIAQNYLYEIKYEPYTRFCDLFYEYKKVGHVRMKPSDNYCWFYIKTKEKQCFALDGRNINASHTGDELLLRPSNQQKLASVRYLCSF